MGVVRQLYQLQEVELEIESSEQALSRMTNQLGDSEAVVRTQSQLESEQQYLEELRGKQRSAEWAIEDVVNKLVPAEETLFSGRIRNPKELTSLQHEVDLLKAKRDQLENEALEVMEQVELSETRIARIGSQLEALKAEWHQHQQQLSSEVEKLEAILSDLRHRRQLISAEVVPQVIEFYQELRGKKGTAVAKVEQGVCRGCRISLSTTELQRARGSDLVQCSSCGRILFLG